MPHPHTRTPSNEAMCAEAQSQQTSSVSKGCFVFTANKTQKSLKPEDYMHAKDDQDVSWFRCNTCEALWDRVNGEIEALQSDVNEEIFTDLMEFVKSAQVHFVINPNDLPMIQQSQTVTREIPTAAFITGVNVTDHCSTFDSITSQLKDQVTPFVANLLSRNCGNLRALMSNFVSQLIGADDSMVEEKGEHNLRRIPASMVVVGTWYHEQVKTRKCQQRSYSPPKSTRKSQQHRKRSISKLETKGYVDFPPVVIIFEDLECFTSKVLQDFVLICSDYLSKLPFVFIFGIATSVTAVHRILPQAVSSLLSIQKFQAQPSSIYLSKLIDKVLLNPAHPFHVGYKVFQLLLDIFLFHDFSVINFVKGLQYAMMDHFFMNPLSILCCNYGEGLNRLRTLSHVQLELFRQASSFRKYVEDQDPDQQRLLLLDDKYLKKTIKELLKQLFDYHKTLYPLMECLHIMTNHLPHHPLGKHQRELYSLCLERNIWESKGYKEAFGLLRLIARDELLILLEALIQRLSSPDNPAQETRFQLETFHTQLATLNDGGDLNTSDVEEESSEESGGKKQRVTLRSLQQKLMESAKKTRKPTRYESLVNDILEYIDSQFRKYLVCPQSKTLHEVFYYNSVSDIRCHINASPRAAIQTALNNPFCYLQSESCKADTGGVISTMPDICIIYKLHMECGRLINLYDWFQAFVTIVSCGKNDESIHGTAEKPDQKLQARFIRAVSELQFLGFIKSTRKKTDHVARLTWGGI